jgi:sugar phosphate isomerase/epimerase
MMNRRSFLTAASALPTFSSYAAETQPFHAGTCLGGQSEEAFWNNCDNAAEAGFHFIESSGAGLRLAEIYKDRPQRLKESLERRHLVLSGYAQYSSMSDPSKQKALIEQHLNIGRVLKPIGTRYITQLLTPPPKSGLEPSQLEAAMTDEEIASFATNVTAVAKALHSELGMQIGFHAETADVAAGLVDKLMKQTDPTYFGLIADIGHIRAGGLDPLQVCERYKSRIVAVHLRDWDPEAKYERKGRSFTGRFVPLGQGKIDLPGVIHFLREMHFSGQVNSEAGAPGAAAEYMKEKLSLEL